VVTAYRAGLLFDMNICHNAFMYQDLSDPSIIMYIHIHTCIHIYMYVYIYICIYVCIYVTDSPMPCTPALCARQVDSGRGRQTHCYRT
jgi:hypothetical protein